MGGSVILGCAACAAVGGLILALAIWQMRTGNVRVLHGYHYANVPVGDRTALALKSGHWLAVVGACVVLLGFSLLLPSPVADIVAMTLIITLFVAIIMTCVVIVKHNGSLFG